MWGVGLRCVATDQSRGSYTLYRLPPRVRYERSFPAASILRLRPKPTPSISWRRVRTGHDVRRHAGERPQTADVTLPEAPPSAYGGGLRARRPRSGEGLVGELSVAMRKHGHNPTPIRETIALTQRPRLAGRLGVEATGFGGGNRISGLSRPSSAMRPSESFTWPSPNLYRVLHKANGREQQSLSRRTSGRRQL